MTLILRENLSTRPEPKNETDKYAVAVAKDAQVIGHWKKGKTGRYAKTVFFLRANPTNTISVIVTEKKANFRDGKCLQIQERRKIYWRFNKTVGPAPFTIVCTLKYCQ